MYVTYLIFFVWWICFNIMVCVFQANFLPENNVSGIICLSYWFIYSKLNRFLKHTSFEMIENIERLDNHSLFLVRLSIISLTAFLFAIFAPVVFMALMLSFIRNIVLNNYFIIKLLKLKFIIGKNTMIYVHLKSFKIQHISLQSNSIKTW